MKLVLFREHTTVEDITTQRKELAHKAAEARGRLQVLSGEAKPWS